MSVMMSLVILCMSIVLSNYVNDIVLSYVSICFVFFLVSL